MGQYREAKKRKGSSVGDRSDRGSRRVPSGEGNGPAKASKPSQPESARPDIAPGLYIVSTPIGHARDITLRALETLAAADVIACEDTRVTGKLLAIHKLSTPMTPYHEHNARHAGPALIKRLEHGDRVALVSDAGMPLVSDPGYRLVRACIDAGIPVVPVPGPSSPVTALAVSGLPTDRFLFAGFPPSRAQARRRFLADIAAIPATLVLMESPNRLAASLAAMAAELGDRDAVVARELTKLFEEVRRGTLSALADAYGRSGPPKGEITIVIAPPSSADEADSASADSLLSEALETLSVRDSVDKVAAETGMARNRLYARALELRRQDT